MIFSYELHNIHEPSNDLPAVSGKKRYTMGMINAFKLANTSCRCSVYVLVQRERNEIIPMYVPHDMFWNEGPVTITTTKLKIQLDAVLKAFAGARMRNPTISAGYSPSVRWN